MNADAGAGARDDTRLAAERNRRVALGLAGVAGLPAFVIAVVVVGVLTTWPTGVLAGVVAGAAAVAGVWRGSAPVLLRWLGAREVDETEEPRLHNLVGGLCAMAGLAPPAVFVVEDPAGNAVTFRRGHRTDVLVVTTGLAQHLTRIELEGVVAHELAHLHRGDAAVATLAGATVGMLVAWTGAGAGLLALVIGEDREIEADREAARLTRYPPGLLTALERLAERGVLAGNARSRGAGRRRARRRAAALRATAGSWIVPPVVLGAATSAALPARLEMLGEL